MGILLNTGRSGNPDDDATDHGRWRLQPVALLDLPARSIKVLQRKVLIVSLQAVQNHRN